MKKGCKLLPKISGLKEYRTGGGTIGSDGKPGRTTKRKRQPRPNKLRGEEGKHIFHKQ